MPFILVTIMFYSMHEEVTGQVFQFILFKSIRVRKDLVNGCGL